MKKEIEIIQAAEKDHDDIWRLFKAIIDQKIYYPFAIDTPRSYIEANWINSKNSMYVAKINHQIVGAYIVKPNAPGWGSHIANAAYMVDQSMRNSGIGRQLVIHSLATAKDAGYRGMQYNLVVGTNKNALHLWKSVGFEIIGKVPEGFLHHELGYVDAYIFYKKLV